MKNIIKLALGIALVAHFTACGTIMHPDREGQREGRLDAGVALLDAIGLLFFIIPGIVAFAVDFSEGTIYLPPRGQDKVSSTGLREIKFDPRLPGRIGIEKALGISLAGKDVKVCRLHSYDEMAARLAAAPQG